MAFKPDSVTHSSSGSDLAAKQELTQLRNVLLGPYSQQITDLSQQINDLQDKLNELESRIVNPNKRAADIGEILAPAVKLSRTSNDQLSRELKPILVEKFHETSRDDPETMAEALFPILGPAVRKMIINIVTPDKQKNNRAYRVEQLFLIYGKSGLPICHVASEKATTQDADMVSGMLSAIQSFVHDAFQTNEFDGLNTLELGELSVWIEWGPKAILAAVVRGAPPKALRDAMQIEIEKIHQNYKTELLDYQGDNQDFKALQRQLHAFLYSHDGSLKNRIRNLPESAKRNLILILTGFTIFCLWLINQYFENSRWEEFIGTLENEPGIVITGFKEVDDVYQIYGLRDPLSEAPAELLANSNTDRQVDFQLQPYIALQADFVRRRAREILNPPDSVKITVKDRTLRISGSASASWISSAKSASYAAPGVLEVLFNVKVAKDSK